MGRLLGGFLIIGFIIWLLGGASNTPQSSSATSPGQQTTVMTPERPLIFPPAFPPRPNGPFEVQMAVVSDGTDKPTILGATNLPDGSSLLVGLRRPEAAYFAQANATVSEGKFKAGPFGKGHDPIPPGDYMVEITFPLAMTQPKAVQDIVGAKSEHIRGKLVKKSSFGITAEYSTKLNFRGQPSATEDAKGRADAQSEAEKREKDLRWSSQVLLVRALRKSMKNPESFKVEDATELKDGTICISYRATNSFNAIVPGQAVLSIKGGSVTSDDREKFRAKWNATCAKQSGRDISYIRRAI